MVIQLNILQSKWMAAAKISNAIEVHKNYCCKANLLNYLVYDKNIDCITNLYFCCWQIMITVQKVCITVKVQKCASA